MLIRDGTIQLNADDVMHKEEAEGIGDVGLILWGGPSKKSNKQLKSMTPTPTTTTTTTTESNIAKIMDAMPSANEDMIRVVELTDDEHYGKGRAKPKYISMVLAKMNSTQYKGEITTTTTTSTSSTSPQTNAPPTTVDLASTTDANDDVMKISHSVKMDAKMMKKIANESSTPIIMGEHMEYTISISS